MNLLNWLCVSHSFKNAEQFSSHFFWCVSLFRSLPLLCMSMWMGALYNRFALLVPITFKLMLTSRCVYIEFFVCSFLFFFCISSHVRRSSSQFDAKFRKYSAFEKCAPHMLEAKWKKKLCKKRELDLVNWIIAKIMCI